MTCRAPLLAELLAVVWASPPPENTECHAPAAFAAVLPDSEGLQITVTVCATHAEVLASQVDGVRLVKRRT
jgi:hypothetical protein